MKTPQLRSAFSKFDQLQSILGHKRQRRRRQSVTAKQEKSQTPKFLTAIVTLPNLS